MKRILALLLALAMLLALTACGKDEEGTPIGESTGATTKTTENTNTPTDGTQGSTEGTTESTTGNTTTPTTTPTTESTPDTTTPIPTEPKPTESPTTEPLVTEPPVTEPSGPEPIKTTSVALSVSSVKLFVGEKATVTATVKPNNATDKTIKWTSSNTAIATVANGAVTAHKVGTATITATASGGQTATCKVTVEQKEEPKPTEPAVPTVKEKKYTGHEIVSVSSPEQALLTRFYGGANKAFCKNDSMTIQINMSNGKATEEDLSVELPYGCSYSISGNRITFVFDGSESEGGGKIVVKNSDGTKNEIPIDVTVVKVTSLSSSTAELKNQFVKYGNKRGLTFIPNGNDFVLKYNGGYTKDDKTKSITGCTIVGTDDYISMSDNSNWIYDALDLVDEYNSRGFNKWTFHINAYSFATLAE